MKSSLTILARVLSSIVLIVFQFSCEDNGDGNAFESLLDGQIEYIGTFPALKPVTYTTKEGETITFNYAYPGFLTLITDPSTPFSTVTNDVEVNGGNIVDAIPKAGLYVVQVERGQENVVLSAIYDYSWFRNGSPLFPITIGARLVAIDYFVPDGSYTSPCGSEHGQHVADIMGRSGDTVREVDMCGWLQCQNNPPPAGTAARLLVEEMESAYIAREQVVVNISLQSEASGKSKSSDKRRCSTNQCKEIRKSQLIFLIELFQSVEEQEQDVADNAAITIIAGNAGVELDHQLQALQDQYKKASKRIKIVGGLTLGGIIDYHYNSASSNMVFAMANEVDALGHLCDGTSFASPEVARILGYIWEQVPSLTSEQLMVALDNTLGSDPKIPQDPTTGWTTKDFISRVVSEAMFIAGVQQPSTKYTLVVGKTGTGSGSVSVSATAPGTSCGTDCYEYLSGTVVTLTAKPDEGSEFTGWTGSCSGTGSCVVTMNATELVSANFEKFVLPETWTGTYNLSNSPPDLILCPHLTSIKHEGNMTIDFVQSGDNSFNGNVTITGVKTSGTLDFNDAHQHLHCVVLDGGSLIGTISGNVSGNSVNGTIDFGDVFAFYNTISFYGIINGNNLTGSLQASSSDLGYGSGDYNITKQ